MPRERQRALDTASGSSLVGAVDLLSDESHVSKNIYQLDKNWIIGGGSATKFNSGLSLKLR